MMFPHQPYNRARATHCRVLPLLVPNSGFLDRWEYLQGTRPNTSFSGRVRSCWICQYRVTPHMTIDKSTKSAAGGATNQLFSVHEWTHKRVRSKDPVLFDVKDKQAEASLSVQVWSFKYSLATAIPIVSNFCFSSLGYPWFLISAICIVFATMTRINPCGLTHADFHDKCEVSLETISQLYHVNVLWRNDCGLCKYSKDVFDMKRQAYCVVHEVNQSLTLESWEWGGPQGAITPLQAKE